MLYDIERISQHANHEAIAMTENQITEQHVQARVDDWVKRVQRLYDDIKSWLKTVEGLRVDENQNATMYEELMEKVGISPQPMPTLDIYDGVNLIARLKPIGLWVIGANGRVDLMRKGGAVVLVDESDQFQPSKWMAHDRQHYMVGQALTQDYFLRLLGIEKHECV